MTKMLHSYDITLESDTAADWADQKSWGVFIKKPLFVKFSARPGVAK